MLLLAAYDLRYSLGERDLLAGVNAELRRGDRAALLGANGAGKTTLLRVLQGKQQAESDELWRTAGVRIAALEQHQSWVAGVQVGELLQAANPYRALEAGAAALAAQLGEWHEPGGAAHTLERWSALQEELETREAAAWPARVGRILAALGLRDLPELEAREARTLSGGEGTRLALALALAQEPDILLLDEPTNHLDVRMREWLEGWLVQFAASGGAALFTSHDRDFLDAAAQRSLWLEGGTLREYAGGYTQASAQRKLERRSLQRQRRQGTRERQRLAGAAGQRNRWGVQPRSIRTRAERVQPPEAPLAERQIRMQLLAASAHAPLLAWGEHLSVSYGGRQVLRDVRFRLRRGDRVCLLGANGTGKSTLLRLLAGELAPDPGPPKPTLQFAGGVTAAYLDQTWHGLDPARPLYTQFEERFGKRAAALLGAAGLGAAYWDRHPDKLSGGERSRAGLALVGSLRADLLLLDEPTNHLDIAALEALEHAVKAYSGGLLLVTHDRRFAREVATRLWLLEDGELREVSGWGRSDYTDPARVLGSDPPPPLPAPTAPQHMFRLERRLLDLRAALDAPQTLTGREQARMQAEAAALQGELYAAYSEVYGAPIWDDEVPEPPFRVRGLHLGEGGGIFWAAGPAGEPLELAHFAWDSETLRPSGPLPPWAGPALLGGTLRLLFERWGVGRVRLGEDGPVLRRRDWFGRTGRIRL